MAEPTLEQMIDALESRKAARPASFVDIIKQLLYPRPQAPINQPLPRFDASGKVVDPRNLNDVLLKR